MDEGGECVRRVGGEVVMVEEGFGKGEPVSYVVGFSVGGEEEGGDGCGRRVAEGGGVVFEEVEEGEEGEEGGEAPEGCWGGWGDGGVGGEVEGCEEGGGEGGAEEEGAEGDGGGGFVVGVVVVDG